MTRPARIDESFDLSIDMLTCLWGGLMVPKLCGNELKMKLASFPHLISLKSSFPEESQLSRDNYFSICSDDDRFRSVANQGACMVAVFAFESLRNHRGYDKVKDKVPVMFLRHLRNAASHGNNFNFISSQSGKIIDPGRVEWGSKIINKDLQGKTAFPDFFPQGDFAYLF
ncbi:MAG: hypothetical protein HN991_00135, partial [Candidatus Jacksonbacteria bacterium]|nr:hypothetical protein [Candidatus Jacksonbacteria bacterium]